MAANQQNGSSEPFLPRSLSEEKFLHILDSEIERFLSGALSYEGQTGSCTSIASEAMADSLNVSTSMQKSEEPKELMQESEEVEISEQLEYMKGFMQSRWEREQEQMRSPGMQEQFGVQSALNLMSATEVGAAAVKDAHDPYVDAFLSFEAEGAVKATWSLGLRCPSPSRIGSLLIDIYYNMGNEDVAVENDMLVPLYLHYGEIQRNDRLFESFMTGNDIGRKVSDEGVDGLNINQLGGGVLNTRSYLEALQDTYMNGTIKPGIHAVTTVCFANMLQVQAVGAIAPEPARDGSMQAGNSKADTYNLWFNVVFCVGVLFGIFAFVVAVMQYRRSRRIHTVSAPTQQMLTMQRRSRVQYIIVEEETIHRIEDMA